MLITIIITIARRPKGDPGARAADDEGQEGQASSIGRYVNSKLT